MNVRKREPVIIVLNDAQADELYRVVDEVQRKLACDAEDAFRITVASVFKRGTAEVAKEVVRG